MIYTNKKEKILFIIISIAVTFSLLIIFIPFINNNTKKSSFSIESNEPIKNNTISISNLNLKPGLSKSSNIKFICKKSGNYYIDFDFSEKGIGDINQYVLLTIIKDDEILFNDYLNVLFDNNDFYIQDDFKKDDSMNLEFKFEMPEDVGNEAEGKMTNFDIKITIK